MPKRDKLSGKERLKLARQRMTESTAQRPSRRTVLTACSVLVGTVGIIVAVIRKPKDLKTRDRLTGLVPWKHTDRDTTDEVDAGVTDSAQSSELED